MFSQNTIFGMQNPSDSNVDYLKFHFSHDSSTTFAFTAFILSCSALACSLFVGDLFFTRIMYFFSGVYFLFSAFVFVFANHFQFILSFIFYLFYISQLFLHCPKLTYFLNLKIPIFKYCPAKPISSEEVLQNIVNIVK